MKTIGINSSKPVEFFPTPQNPEIDDDEICDRTLIIEIDYDDDFATKKPTDDPTPQSPEDQQTNSSKVTRVITFDVCSTKLANKSPFFDKMFSIGMKESCEKVVTLKIAGYEEAAFKDMINYIKTNKLSSKNYMELLELLMIADRFEVPSCTKSCVDSLLLAPMDHELALLIRNIPRGIAEIGDARRLIIGAEMFFKGLTNFDGFPDDLGVINQGIIECVLSRNDLRLDSEDEAYDFLMKWLMSHLSDPEERREFLQARVSKLIRFPCLSNSKLSSFYECPYVEDKLKYEIKLEMEAYKKKYMLKPLWYYSYMLECNNKRLYKFFPATVFLDDDKMCLVLLEMNWREFNNLVEVRSQRTCTFSFDEQDFHLVIEYKCNGRKPRTLEIWLHSGSEEEGKGKSQRIMRMRLKVEDLMNPREFSVKARKLSALNRRKYSIGFDHFFVVEWKKLLSANSGFFNNGSMVIKFLLTKLAIWLR